MKETMDENLKLTDYMNDLEARMFDANKRSLDTLKIMREMEVERATL